MNQPQSRHRVLRLWIYFNFLLEISNLWWKSVAKWAQSGSENRPWHCFPCDNSSSRPILNASNIHAFISFQCFTHVPKGAAFVRKEHLWCITSPRLCPPPPWDAPLVICKWVLCPCGGVLLKVEQPPRVRTHTVRSTAGSDPKPDIPPSLVAGLLWQPACCGCLTVAGQGFLCSVAVVVLGISVSSAPSHWHGSPGAKDAVYWGQNTDTCPSGRFCAHDLTRRVFVFDLCWRFHVGLTLSASLTLVALKKCFTRTPFQMSVLLHSERAQSVEPRFSGQFVTFFFMKMTRHRKRDWTKTVKLETERQTPNC